MSLLIFYGDQSLPAGVGLRDDILVERGVCLLSGEIVAAHLLTPEGCVVRASVLFVETAEIHGDVEVTGNANLGESSIWGNFRCHKGLRLTGDLIVYGDLVVTGAEMVTNHKVIVRGRARFDRRPEGLGAIYCDDAGPCGPDGT